MTHSRQLAAIMFTDIVGYSSLMEKNEENAIQVREKHRNIFNTITKKHNGRILQYYGDGTLSIFDSAIEAVNCGIEMQLGFQKDPAIPVRIGIHTGDIIFSEEEIIGDSVNVASRVESLAVSGSVFISDKVYDEIKNQKSIQTSLLKTFKLKNIRKPIEVYAISNLGLIVPKAEEIEIKAGTNIQTIQENENQVDLNIQQEVSPSIILATKIYIPSLRSNVVQRPRLINKINDGLYGKLTLISAPPGFGKTTLVSEWISNCERPVVWISLDDGDNDHTRFLEYLVAALQTIAPEIGEGVLAMLHSSQPPSTESVLTALLNEIAAIPENFVLILDDYHVINSSSVIEVLNFIMEHQTPQMHIMMTTREDPNLPLARLRVRSQLTEIREVDLRFNPIEASEFLKNVMGLNLSAKNVTILENRTEGWIAGLQLAALSMKGRDDISGFVKAFAGHDKYIVDYLGEEVLLNQTEKLQSFLLQTSVLKRLCASLCDSVTEHDNSRMTLEELEQSNLFIVPLDNSRRWYRYHNLFSEVLQSKLKAEQPELISILHERASKWYEKNNLTIDAVYHALAAEDFERVAGMIELAWPEMNRNGKFQTWLKWIMKIPEDIIIHRPVLNVSYAWALMESGDLEAGEARLKKSEKWIKSFNNINYSLKELPEDIIVADKEQLPILAASIYAARAYYSGALGRFTDEINFSIKSIDLLPDKNNEVYAISSSLLGLAYLNMGDLESAFENINNGKNNMYNNEDIISSIGVTTILADIRISQGRIREAISEYERSIKLAENYGGYALRGTADLYLGLSELYHEQGNDNAATKNLQNAEIRSKDSVLADWPFCWSLAQARIKEAQGDLNGAIDMLNKAEDLHFRTPMPIVRPVSALKTKVWIAQGRLTEALEWVNEKKLSINDELHYLKEFEHITLARVLIACVKNKKAESSIDEIVLFLDRLLKAAENGGRTGSAIEILILQAMAHEVNDNVSLGILPLKRALTLAEPEGYFRIFVNEGTSMFRLLTELSAQGIMPDYIKKMLNSLNHN